MPYQMTPYGYILPPPPPRLLNYVHAPPSYVNMPPQPYQPNALSAASDASVSAISAHTGNVGQAFGQYHGHNGWT